MRTRARAVTLLILGLLLAGPLLALGRGPNPVSGPEAPSAIAASSLPASGLQSLAANASLNVTSSNPPQVAGPLPSVSFSLSPASRQAEAGTRLAYTVSGGNSGNGTASRVWVNVTLPASLAYVSGGFGVTPSVAGSTVSWTWTDYAPGSHTYPLNLTATDAALDNTTADLLFSVASVDLRGDPQPPRTFGGRVSFLAPAWLLTVTADRETALARGEVTYTLRAQNVGSTAATFLWLVLPLDDHVVLITHTATVPASGTSTMNWTFPDVQPGQSIVFSVLVQVAAGTPANTAIEETLEAHFTNSLGVVLGTVRSAAALIEVDADLMPLVYILLIGSLAGTVLTFFVYRRYRVRIEDAFLINRDGVLISHLANPETRGEGQLSGMLTAVQDFVHDAFSYGEHRELHQLEFGDTHILIERGDHVYLAVVYRGRDSGVVRKKVRAVLATIESAFGAAFASWDGDVHRVEGTRELLLQGFTEKEHAWSFVKAKES